MTIVLFEDKLAERTKQMIECRISTGEDRSDYDGLACQTRDRIVSHTANLNTKYSNQHCLSFVEKLSESMAASFGQPRGSIILEESPPNLKVGGESAAVATLADVESRKAMVAKRVSSSSSSGDDENSLATPMLAGEEREVARHISELGKVRTVYCELFEDKRSCL